MTGVVVPLTIGGEQGASEGVDPAPGQPITALMIEAVGKCNATCSYCPRGAGLLDPSTNTFITMEILDKALRLAKGGRNHAVYLHHRGEPFLHPKLPEIIRRVRDAGFYAFLSTNLISATPPRVEAALKAGLNQMEMHLSAGMTRLPLDTLLARIHNIRRMNWRLRNFGCRLEVNFGLADGQTKDDVMAKMAESPHYDELLFVRWFDPHDWPSLEGMPDRGVDYRACQWFQHRACAILSDGSIVICCLDQFSKSRRVNVMEIERIEWSHLADRRLCAGCVQHIEMDWLQEDAIDMPTWLARKIQVDSWTA